MKDAQGNILEETVTEEPVPGSSVVLTLDTELQAAAQQAIDDVIQELRKLPDSNKNDGHDVKSGSAVVLDVRDGGVLACATWPNYDLSTYSQDYNELVNDPDKPLFNRATHGIYTFGSTVKPLVSFAGLMTGKLTPSETVYCTGQYDYYDYHPGCMGVHQTTNMVRALEKSCNYYFYEAGRRLGATTINEYAALFGLGQKTRHRNRRGHRLSRRPRIPYRPRPRALGGPATTCGRASARPATSLPSSSRPTP